MDTNVTRWESKPYDIAAALQLSDELGVSPGVAAILTRRGLGQPAAAREFLAAEEHHDPATLPGAPAAVERVLAAVDGGRRVVVYGDYDVDGVCSTAILVRALRALGVNPAWELPSRSGEGYGLTGAAVERLAAQGADLLVTVDCGITAVAEVAAAQRAGIEVIVTDHHRPGAELPACPIVHPALGDYGTPELCASGVALKLAEALFAAAGRDPALAADDLDLAALATVCDIVPLVGENRRIVKQGLTALSRTSKAGLRALMSVAAVEPAEVDEACLGFRLGPRINAAGRMQRADAALELLLTEDAGRAKEIAEELDGLNHDRREAEERILFAAQAAAAAQASAAALVVAGEGWHPGVVGIVASRLVEQWNRPSVVIALDGDRGRGSGRSIRAYDLHGGLEACSEYLTRFGGHRVAAGLELDAARVPAFRAALARHAGRLLTPSDLEPVERVDAVVPAGALGLPLAEELDGLRPFGAGNPTPTLLVPAARLHGLTAMGSDRQHARFSLVSGGSRASGVAFGCTPGNLADTKDRPHDIALRLEKRRWNGMDEPRVQLRACCPTRTGRVEVLGEDGGFWERLEEEFRREPAAARREPARNQVRDRRGEGFTGVAGDLLTSGAGVLVVVADIPRRLRALEELIAALAPAGLPVVAWDRIESVDCGFDHLVALDPAPLGERDPLLGSAPVAHLTWGPPEIEFALRVWRAALDLRPALADAWRALRDGTELRSALEGSASYPRSPEVCGRLLRVLTELDLVEADLEGPTYRVTSDARTDLDRSSAYRAYRARCAEIEAALAPRAAPARVAA